jgi:Matrixin
MHRPAGLFRRLLTASPSRSPRKRAQLQIEALESRLAPYAASGNLWPHPNLITISFEPDGTNLGGPTSNLFASFNSRFGSATAWENAVLKAAQTWSAQTNLNFAVVPDNGTASGSGSYQQGDPGMGDIRIGGYNFNNTSILALGYMPPPVNNYSIAGDVGFNTGQSYHMGSTYDLYTVAMHEIGHALGLDHSSTSAAAMYASYGGVKSALTADDIAGIRSIYSNGQPRTPDRFNTGSSSNNSFTAAANIGASITKPALNALVTNLDITTAGQAEYFQFTAPSGGSGSVTLTVQSQGLSLLAPSVSVYNAGQTQLATLSGAGQYGATLKLTVSGIKAGQTYYIKVTGADSTVFGTGAYALTVNLGSAASPTVPLPNTQTTNGSPLNGGGGLADRTDSNGLSVTSLLNGLLGLLGIDLPFVDPMTPDAHFLEEATSGLPISSIPVSVTAVTFGIPTAVSTPSMPAFVMTPVAAPAASAVVGTPILVHTAVSAAVPAVEPRTKTTDADRIEQKTSDTESLPTEPFAPTTQSGPEGGSETVSSRRTGTGTGELASKRDVSLMLRSRDEYFGQRIEDDRSTRRSAVPPSRVEAAGFDNLMSALLLSGALTAGRVERIGQRTPKRRLLGSDRAQLDPNGCR